MIWEWGSGIVGVVTKGLEGIKIIAEVLAKLIKNGKLSRPESQDIIKIAYGVLILVVVLVVVLVMLFKGHESIGNVLKSASVTTLDIKTKDVIDDEKKDLGTNIVIYVKDKLYKNATYTGYIDKETERPNGQGVMEYIDNRKYNGEWEDGIRQGEGYMEYNNGDTYDGEWKNDKKDGQGTYTWRDGRKYVGAYKNDMRDGDGIYSGWTGFVSTYGWTGTYYGISSKDKFEGMGKFKFDNGDSFEGIFRDNGFWNGTYMYKDGSTYEIQSGKPV